MSLQFIQLICAESNVRFLYARRIHPQINGWRRYQSGGSQTNNFFLEWRQRPLIDQKSIGMKTAGILRSKTLWEIKETTLWFSLGVPGFQASPTTKRLPWQSRGASRESERSITTHAQGCKQIDGTIFKMRFKKNKFLTSRDIQCQSVAEGIA